MLRALGFETVYSYATLPDLLDGQPLRPSSGTNAATDHDLFQAFIAYLKHHEAAKQPFFLSLYNIGTHAFLDSDAEGIKYADGLNPALNRMHNYDQQIAPLLDYFLTSPLANNTIFIFTTDHATYNEPPVVDALRRPDYKPYFVDEIPLLIYDKGLSLPHRFDAKYRNSLDFAPTLLHLLSVNDVENSFMGRSLFDPVPNYYKNISSLGEDFYDIDRLGVTKNADIKHPDPNYTNYLDYIKTYWLLELQNRIFMANSAP